MTKYDPEVTPDPVEWLELDEQERMILVEDYHRAARIKLPNIKVHALVHAVVENQIAEGLEYVVRAMARLAKDGLSRHDALHAVGCILTEHIFEILKLNDAELAKARMARYEADLEKLTAKSS